MVSHQYAFAVASQPYQTHFITVSKVVAARLYFHRCLSFCSRGGGMYPSMHWGRHPPPRRSLQRTVRILLKSILVFQIGHNFVLLLGRRGRQQHASTVIAGHGFGETDVWRKCVESQTVWHNRRY